MAGGFNKEATGLPAWLVEANATARREAAERQAAIQALRPDRPTHVWVTISYEGDLPVQVAGLLLDWRRRGAGWEALVVLGRGGDSFVAQWLDAEQVQRAGTTGSPAQADSPPTPVPAPATDTGAGAGASDAGHAPPAAALVPETLGERSTGRDQPHTAGR